MSLNISKHILEVRHQPYLNFLDIKGKLASSIIKLDCFNFHYWVPGENRIDFMDKSEKIKAFVSLTNFGMVVEDAPSSNYFSDQAVLFIKSLSAKNDFSDREIVRIGTRSFFIAGRKESFEDLKKKYLENFLELKPNAIKIFGSNPVDVGAPFNFIVNKSEAFNTMSGPMEREQMKKFLKPIKIYNDDKLPKQGLYFEIDYFTQNVGRIKEEELESIVRSNIEKSAGIFERFKKTILDLEN